MTFTNWNQWKYNVTDAAAKQGVQALGRSAAASFLTETNTALTMPNNSVVKHEMAAQEWEENRMMLLNAPKFYVISSSSFSSMEEADDAF
jgi:hypothetical protein